MLLFAANLKFKRLEFSRFFEKIVCEVEYLDEKSSALD